MLKTVHQAQPFFLLFQKLLNFAARLPICVPLHIQPNDIRIASEPRHLALGKLVDGNLQLAHHLVVVEISDDILCDVFNVSSMNYNYL